MTTPSILTARGDLIRFELDDDDRLLPQRSLFLTRSLEAWFDGTLVYERSDRNSTVSPYDQVYGIFRSYTVGHRLFVGNDCKLIQPTDAGVCALRTDDVRIFGWFHLPCCFIADQGEMRRRLGSGRARSFADLRRAVLETVRNMGLADPKIHPERDLDALL